MRQPRLRCLLPSLRDPDWNAWRKVPNAELWQVVALSCAIEPACVAQWIQPRTPTTERLTEYQNRLIEAVAALEAHGGELASLSTNAENEKARVELGNFKDWAINAGWQMPEDFPAFPATIVKREPPKERSVRLKMLINAERAKGMTLKRAIEIVASTERSQAPNKAGGEKIAPATLKKIYYKR